jgi:cytochrome c oxidase subunit 2
MTIIGIRADRALRGRASRLLALATSLAAAPAWADYKLNMPEGVTTTSHEIYDLHMLVFWVCTLIAIGVYGVMVYAIVKFRKSAGAKPAQFSHNTTAEVVWTVIPAVILVALAIPAAGTLIRMNDTRNAQLTIKVTGYQWRWQYDYLDDGVKFFSVLDRKSNAARQLRSGIDPKTVENYLLEVDKPMVVPVNTKVRLLVTAADVIHSWWVPVFAVKQDAIPGYINEVWFTAREEGTYRGQCVELCGMDHGFMPIVVKVLSQTEYDTWLASQKAAAQTSQNAAQ